MSLLREPPGGPGKGDFEARRKCILLQARAQIETGREGGALDKHVLTPFYGGLYLRADPLGLCRLPLGRPGQFGQS